VVCSKYSPPSLRPQELSRPPNPLQCRSLRSGAKVGNKHLLVPSVALRYHNPTCAILGPLWPPLAALLILPPFSEPLSQDRVSRRRHPRPGGNLTEGGPLGWWWGGLPGVALGWPPLCALPPDSLLPLPFSPSPPSPYRPEEEETLSSLVSLGVRGAAIAFASHGTAVRVLGAQRVREGFAFRAHRGPVPILALP